MTYTLSLTAASSIPGGFPSKAGTVSSDAFDVQIGVVPEPSTLALALAGVLVAMLTLACFGPPAARNLAATLSRRSGRILETNPSRRVGNRHEAMRMPEPPSILRHSP